MQIPLPIFVKSGLAGMKIYVAASDAYLLSTLHRKSMSFNFPEIRLDCPVCHGSSCARWKGYYIRIMQDATLAVLGPIVIRYGRCMRLKTEFSFLPDFLLPRRRLTIPTLSAMSDFLNVRSATLQQAVDVMISPWAEILYLPISTAHSSLEHLAWLKKSRNIATALKRRLMRRLLEPERSGSILISSILKVVEILQMASLSPP